MTAWLLTTWGWLCVVFRCVKAWALLAYRIEELFTNHIPHMEAAINKQAGICQATRQALGLAAIEHEQGGIDDTPE